MYFSKAGNQTPQRPSSICTPEAVTLIKLSVKSMDTFSEGISNKQIDSYSAIVTLAYISESGRSN